MRSTAQKTNNVIPLRRVDNVDAITREWTDDRLRSSESSDELQRQWQWITILLMGLAVVGVCTFALIIGLCVKSLVEMLQRYGPPYPRL